MDANMTKVGKNVKKTNNWYQRIAEKVRITIFADLNQKQHKSFGVSISIIPFQGFLGYLSQFIYPPNAF